LSVGLLFQATLCKADSVWCQFRHSEKNKTETKRRNF